MKYDSKIFLHHHMGLVKGKPVFLVCDYVRLKPTCLATETSYNIEFAFEASLTILKPTAKRSPYTFKLVQKVKYRVCKIHVLSEAILCLDSASYFI